MWLPIAAAILAGAWTISAHGWIDNWEINSLEYPGYNPTISRWVEDQGTISWHAWNTDTGPVYSRDSNTTDIICSVNATNAKKLATSVEAGTTINLHWTAWPDSHHGPILSYLGACNGDCATADKQKLKWFKIAETGQIALGPGGGTAGRWADDILRETNGSWSVAIPSFVKAGNYVLRNEIIALHSAYDVGAAQLYPQCANIQIIGDGDITPEGVVGTALYSATDPGLHYNIYNDESMPVYQIPGPPLCKLCWLPTIPPQLY